MLKFLRRRSDGTVISVDDASTEYARRTRTSLASDGAVDTVVPARWEEVDAGGGSAFAHLTEDADNSQLVADWTLVATQLRLGPDDYSESSLYVAADGIQVWPLSLGAYAFAAGGAADAQHRVRIHADGSLHWGDGTAAPDVSLVRENGSLTTYSQAGVSGFYDDTQVSGFSFAIASGRLSLYADPFGVQIQPAADKLLSIMGDGAGLQLHSPDGTAYNITVANDGTVTSTAA